MKLNWIEIGNTNSSECIIFLHEGLGCVEMWKDYPSKLCNQLGFRGIVYDRSGYGKSPGSLLNRNANYLHQAANELAKFIAFLGLERVHFYGHSDGGSIALIYAGQYPTSVKSIITEAAHVINEKETIVGVRTVRPLLKEGKMEGLKKYHGERYSEVFYAWNDIWLDPSFKDWNITSEIGQITCPILAIQGVDDHYGTLKQIELISDSVKGMVSWLTPNNCGHSPFKEQTEIVINKVLKFYHEFN